MHMPLLLGMDGKKLSKRKNPTSIFFYRDCGYLPEAFMNFLTLMGYSMPGDLEIYPLENIIKDFDPKRIGVSGAVFDVKKLDWINQQYLIKNIPEEKLWGRIRDWGFNDDFMQKLMPLVHSRIKTFGDFIKLCDFFFINDLNYTPELFQVKNLTPSHAAMILQAIIWYLEENENWTSEGMNLASRDAAEIFSVNHKKAVMPLLFASLMGKKQGPPLFGSVPLLGKDRTRARLLKTIEFLGGISNKKMSELRKGWDHKKCSNLIAD